MGMNLRKKAVPFRMLEFTDTRYVTRTGKERTEKGCIIRHLRWVTTPKGTTWANGRSIGR